MAATVITTRASDRAYATLLDEIQTGVLAPGAVIAEAEQAARLGLSRTPLREALGRLAADGLVEQLSPRVTVVTRFDVDDISDLFAVRQALESQAAQLAATRGDSQLFAQFADRFARADAAGDPDAYFALIAEFDDAIDVAVANDYLVSALRSMRTHLARARRLARDHPARLVASAAEHHLIASAIAASDTALAVHATHVHLHNALASILAAVRAATPASTTEGAA